MAVRRTKRVGQTEFAQQAALIRWAHSLEARRQYMLYPELGVSALDLIFAIPNANRRSPHEQRQRMWEGMKRGVPDLCLPLAGPGGHGLFIEMKAPLGGSPTPEQRWWAEMLNRNGYTAEICPGFTAAQHLIMDYLEHYRTDDRAATITYGQQIVSIRDES